MKVIVGSTSQRKLGSVKKVFEQVLGTGVEVVGIAVESGVPKTPYDKETFDGAHERARSCKKLESGDYFIGLESGLVKRFDHLFEEAWAVILDPKSTEYIGYSSGLKIPDMIVRRMDEQGLKHNEVMEELERELSLQGSETWGSYSGGRVLREISLEEALRNALVQAVRGGRSLYA